MFYTYTHATTHAHTCVHVHTHTHTYSLHQQPWISYIFVCPSVEVNLCTECIYLCILLTLHALHVPQKLLLVTDSLQVHEDLSHWSMCRFLFCCLSSLYIIIIIAATTTTIIIIITYVLFSLCWGSVCKFDLSMILHVGRVLKNMHLLMMKSAFTYDEMCIYL